MAQQDRETQDQQRRRRKIRARVHRIRRQVKRICDPVLQGSDIANDISEIIGAIQALDQERHLIPENVQGYLQEALVELDEVEGLPLVEICQHVNEVMELADKQELFTTISDWVLNRVDQALPQLLSRVPDPVIFATAVVAPVVAVTAAAVILPPMVLPPPPPPIAQIGEPQSSQVNVEITLVGSGSTDPDDDIVSYVWDLDEDGIFDDGSGDTVPFERSEPGLYPIALRVTDEHGAKGTGNSAVLVVPAPITVEAEGPTGTLAKNSEIQAFLSEVTSAVHNAPDSFPVGITTPVTFTATLLEGNSISHTSSIAVVDSIAPDVIPPNSIIVDSESDAGTPAANSEIRDFLSEVTTFDDVDPEPEVTHDAPSLFPVGNTVVTFTATDAAKNPGTGTAIVTVVDLKPPAYGVPSISPQPNSEDWHNSDVTVTFPCTDAASGPLEEQVVMTLFGEGANQVASVSAQDCEDRAGNIALTDGKQGGINIDKTPPETVARLMSTSHRVATWSSNNVVRVQWANSSDSLSQLDTYVATWDTDPTTAVLTKEIGTATSTSSPPLSDGMFHYFHIQAIDRAGNPSEVASFGPFWIDSTPPDTTIEVVKEGPEIFLELSGLDNLELAGFECSLDNAPFKNCTTTDSSKVKARKHRLSVSVDGEHTLRVRAIDSAGNLDLTPAEASWC